MKCNGHYEPYELQHTENTLSCVEMSEVIMHIRQLGIFPFLLSCLEALHTARVTRTSSTDGNVKTTQMRNNTVMNKHITTIKTKLEAGAGRRRSEANNGC
jgi:hypothetical protein